MTPDETVTFLLETDVRDKISHLCNRVRRRLSGVLPDAELQHVGSTSIPGSVTKGDLDIQVRVVASDYEDSKEKLARLYNVNVGGFGSDDAISFEDYSTDPPHGVHLTVIDGSCDVQWRFRDTLRASAKLSRAFDELKRGFEGRSMEQYREAKEEFVLRVQASEQYRALQSPQEII